MSMPPCSGFMIVYKYVQYPGAWAAVVCIACLCPSLHGPDLAVLLQLHEWADAVASVPDGHHGGLGPDQRRTLQHRGLVWTERST
jgi:hypothetical protein